MTCCGRIGLAVGYALGIDAADDNNKPGGVVKDPAPSSADRRSPPGTTPQ